MFIVWYRCSASPISAGAAAPSGARSSHVSAVRAAVGRGLTAVCAHAHLSALTPATGRWPFDTGLLTDCALVTIVKLS